MDLLCSYDVDDEASSNTDQSQQASTNRLNSEEGSLQSEWENFEKMIEQSHAPRTSHQSFGDLAKSPSDSKSPLSHGGVSPTAHLLKQKDIFQPAVEDEDDESHLPPGVRKKNRCHSSSSSDSEDEVKKIPSKDGDLSDTDSDDSANDRKDSQSRSEPQKDAESAKSKDVVLEYASEKTRRSKSKTRSRSRSGSRSRRRSSERSRRSRSRSRDKYHRRERKHKSRRPSSRDRRSRDREHRHRRRDHRRSRSRDHDRERRPKRKESRRSRDRSHRSRSGSRIRSRRDRSQSPRGAKVIKYGDKVIKAGASFGRPPPSKPMTFKEKMRQQLIKAMEEGGDVSQALTSKDGTVLCTQTAGTQQMPAPKKPPVPLMANIVTSTTGLAAATITASEAAMQSMIALQKETTEKTGVEIPKYYNPAAINPVKYAEQVQKRKLLWSKTKEKEVNSQWHATTLSSDHDDKSKEKFRKLMGIRQESASTDGEPENATVEQEQKQKELFDKLDKEYQYARMATHTHRGIGLGFGSASYQPPPGTS